MYNPTEGETLDETDPDTGKCYHMHIYLINVTVSYISDGAAFQQRKEWFMSTGRGIDKIVPFRGRLYTGGNIVSIQKLRN